MVRYLKLHVLIEYIRFGSLLACPEPECVYLKESPL